MAARTVQGYPGGKLTRSKAKLMSTTYEPSSTRTAPQPKTQPPFSSKAKRLSKAPELHSASNPPKKRKRPSSSTPAPSKKVPLVHLTGDGHEANMDLATTPKKRKTEVSLKGQKEEKRLKMFRKKAPLSYLEKLERATGQR